jgi:hypothetical protein
MGNTPITRRTMLRGALGGLAVSVALPPLEAFMNRHGTAYAGDSGFPTRFGIWFWGNGVLPDIFFPAGNGGPSWMPSPLLLPLAALQPDITVISGMRILTGNTHPHGSGPAGFFCGDDLRGETVVGPSLDQMIARQLSGSTRFASLEVGVQRAERSISWAGPNQNNPPETSPRLLFHRLFVDGYRAPGDMSPPDPKVGLRKSVLDAVVKQAGRLQPRLSAADRVRLDQHLSGIRAIEMQLDRLQQSPPALSACKLPAPPLADYPDISGRAQLREISRVMSDLMAMAMACDQTRVFTNTFSQPVSNVLYPNATEGHHQLTHDEADPQLQVQSILSFVMGELAYFLSALKSIPEGAGTLLDHCMVMATTDVSFGRTHSLDNYPVLLAGSANGALKTGMHYRSASNENLCSLALTLLRTMGVSAPSFGFGAGKTSTPLSSILV